MAIVLDIPGDILKDIQTQIDEYVLGVKPGGKQWLNSASPYSHSSMGGRGMINLENFTTSLKASWVKRYTIDKLYDHWADLMDQHQRGQGHHPGLRP